MKTTITAISTIVLLLVVTSTISSAYAEVPGWVKNNAGWWADGIITDVEFVNGIQHLIKSGLILVSVNSEPIQVTSTQSNTDDSGWSTLEADLEQCSEITKAYDRLNCERDAKHQIIAYHYKAVSQAFEVGP
ncbi:MAG: peptidase, partial [Nitrosopumilus sp.]|nr:peptidase [Nitrosopumilus sp.]